MTSRKRAPRATKRGTRTVPPTGWQKSQVARLTKFPPHQLEDLIDGTLGDTAKQISAEVILEIRRRNEAKLEQLVRELGIDPNHPDVWRRAFLQLAFMHHGIGVISWVQPRGSNRRAAKWNDEHDLHFYSMMEELMASGLKPMVALREIAKDRDKWSKLAPQPKNFRSEKSDVERRYVTLKKRWQIVRKTASQKILLRALGTSSFDNQTCPNFPRLSPEGKI
jgi:hypothetical protein